MKKAYCFAVALALLLGAWLAPASMAEPATGITAAEFIERYNAQLRGINDGTYDGVMLVERVDAEGHGFVLLGPEGTGDLTGKDIFVYISGSDNAQGEIEMLDVTISAPGGVTEPWRQQMRAIALSAARAMSRDGVPISDIVTVFEQMFGLPMNPPARAMEPNIVQQYQFDEQQLAVNYYSFEDGMFCLTFTPLGVISSPDIHGGDDITVVPLPAEGGLSEMPAFVVALDGALNRLGETLEDENFATQEGQAATVEAATEVMTMLNAVKALEDPTYAPYSDFFALVNEQMIPCAQAYDAILEQYDALITDTDEVLYQALAMLEQASYVALEGSVLPPYGQTVEDPTPIPEPTPKPEKPPKATTAPEQPATGGDMSLLRAEDIVGSWHDAPEVGAGYGERYIFYADERFVYLPGDSIRPGQADRMEGWWSFAPAENEGDEYARLTLLIDGGKKFTIDLSDWRETDPDETPYPVRMSFGNAAFYRYSEDPEYWAGDM